jgi:hypothetical protein
MLSMSFAAIPALADDDPRSEFYNTWARSDGPIVAQRASRTWMWGPGPYTHWEREPYADSPGGERDVQYFHKTRMEINDPAGDRSSAWFVTNGLLAQELITGRMQVGDDDFEHREPAAVQIAGDQHPDSPTYALLEPLLDWGALPVGAALTQQLHSDGRVESNDAFAAYGATAAYHVPETDHTVANVFWDFMNSQGTIYLDGRFQTGNLFPNPFFATGFPITEAYWVHIPVAEQWQDVLVQCFERRCLTYTPGNDPNWRVEAGNIGQHYYIWRYGAPSDATLSPFPPPRETAPAPPPPPPPPPPSPQPPPADPSPPQACVNLNTASIDELRQIIHIDQDRAQQIINNRPFTSIDQLEPRISGIGPARMNDIREQGLACV